MNRRQNDAEYVVQVHCETREIVLMRDPEALDRRALFSDLLLQNRSRLFAYIHALVRNLADTDDVFQQTALALWRRFDTYDASRPFLNWSMGVARFEVATWLRNRARDRLRFSDELTQLMLDAFAELSADEVSDRQATLPGCVDKLTDVDQLLLKQCYLRGGDVASVAMRLGRSAQSVHNSLKRIRRTLFDCIERALARSTRE
ncbi:sigma-70 family RNA polymerase sigma factor [soil metagenome]